MTLSESLPHWTSVSPLVLQGPSSSELFNVELPLCDRVGQTISEPLPSGEHGTHRGRRGSEGRSREPRRGSITVTVLGVTGGSVSEGVTSFPGENRGFRQNLK